MTTPAHTTAPEKPSAADIAAGVLQYLDNHAATWATSGNRHAARDNLVRAVGFALMRDAFAGTDAADAGFELVDAVEQLARMANRMSFIDPDIHSVEAQYMADQVAQAAYKVADDLAKAWGAM
jgi:hypothetical protein